MSKPRRTASQAATIGRQPPHLSLASSEIRAIPVLGIRDVFPGDNVADLVVDALALGGRRLHDGDIVVIKHKIVSKAEDRRVALDSVRPSAEARRFAADKWTGRSRG